jgi:hypothetical protein
MQTPIATPPAACLSVPGSRFRALGPLESPGGSRARQFHPQSREVIHQFWEKSKGVIRCFDIAKTSEYTGRASDALTHEDRGNSGSIQRGSPPLVIVAGWFCRTSWPRLCTGRTSRRWCVPSCEPQTSHTTTGRLSWWQCNGLRKSPPSRLRWLCPPDWVIWVTSGGERNLGW